MRADRLLHLIRLLSDGRRHTSHALASVLEVSDRTLLRDLEALGMAGIPVQTARGRDGGCWLPREWSRAASGLTAAEVAPLAALTTPDGDAEVRRLLQSALSKVIAGLPTLLRERADAARQRMLIDPTPWWSRDTPSPHLAPLQEAVWSAQRVRLVYASGSPPGPARARDVDPLALVLKAERWHLVAQADAGLRVFRLDRILSLAILPAPSARPPGFDLPTFWQTWSAQFHQSRPAFRVRLRLSAAACTRLAALRPAGAVLVADAEIEVDFQRMDVAVAQLAQVGEGVVVLGPPALCAHLRAVAQAWLGMPTETARSADR